MKPTYTKKAQGRPKTRWKLDMENGITKVAIVNWRKVAQQGDGWRIKKLGMCLSFLYSGATE